MSSQKGNKDGAATNPVAAAVATGVNVFALLFGKPLFKNEPKRKPTVFKTGEAAGTEQYGLAECSFPNFAAAVVPGLEGAAFMHCRITKRISPDKKTTVFAMSMPSIAIGPIRRPVINLKNCPKPIQEQFKAWQKQTIADYKVFRAEFLKGGGKDESAGESVGTAHEEATAEDLAALGLD